MARFNMNEADNYGTANSGSFFTLKNDKDTAKVRFLYKTIDDIEGYAVHRVNVDGKERYVNCLRSYNEPVDNCPFCKAGIKVQPKLFLKLYNEDNGECQIWERGKTYFQKLGSLAARYNPLCDEIIEIERNGKPKDMKTDYVFYPINNEPINLDDEQYQCSEPLGTIILDKSFDDMQDYIETGEFPSDSENVARERTSRDEPPFRESEPVRRTPSSNRRAF
jgi:hypothetical protein